MRNLICIITIAVIIILTLFVLFRGRAKKSKKAMLSVGALLAVAVVVYLWFSPIWNYPDTTGEHGVTSVSALYVDENRTETYGGSGSKRWLNVEIWYPADSEDNQTYPLIVFSHGSFGTRISNVTTYRELASHGYVVCAIDHTYQCLSTLDEKGKKIKVSDEFRKQILSASDSNEDSRARLKTLFSEWMAVRTGDINFVLDRIIACASKGDLQENGVYRLIDTSSIGVMGHSLGGSAALGIGRMREDVNAVIALESPFMYDVTGLRDGGFVFDDAPYPLPVLNVYTDSSWNILESSPQYAQNYAFLNDALPNTFDTYVKGAGHMTLSDLSFSMPPLCLMFGQDMFFDVNEFSEKINRTYLEFFDCFLKDKSEFVPISLVQC